MFTIYNLGPVRNWVENKHRVLGRDRARTRPFAAPQAPGRRQESEEDEDGYAFPWARNNPSTYLIDSGLWTACKESYLAMKRAFHCGDQEVWTCHFLNDEHPDATHYQLFTVLPWQDLFVFQAPELCNRHRYTWLEIYVWGAYGVGNIALEFDPKWEPVYNRGDLEGGMNVFTQIAVQTTEPETGKLESFWLVDYTLKRDNQIPIDRPHQGSRAIFHGSNCRFVQVLPEEADGCGSPWFCDGGATRGSLVGGSFAFAAALTQCNKEAVRKQQDYILQYGLGAISLPVTRMKYGVLAFEYF